MSIKQITGPRQPLGIHMCKQRNGSSTWNEANQQPIGAFTTSKCERKLPWVLFWRFFDQEDMKRVIVWYMHIVHNNFIHRFDQSSAHRVKTIWSIQLVVYNCVNLVCTIKEWNDHHYQPIHLLFSACRHQVYNSISLKVSACRQAYKIQ